MTKSLSPSTGRPRNRRKCCPYFFVKPDRTLAVFSLEIKVSCCQKACGEYPPLEPPLLTLVTFRILMFFYRKMNIKKTFYVIFVRY